MPRAANRPPEQTSLIDCTNANNFTEVAGAGVTRTTDSSVTYNGAATTRVFVPAALATNFEIGVNTASVNFPYLTPGAPVPFSIGVILRTDRPARITGGSVYIGDSSYTNFATGLMSAISANDGWQFMLTGATWTPTGSPTYSGARRTKIRIMVLAGEDANVWIAGYVIFARNRPAFVLTCDDGYDEFYSYLYPACVSRGIPVSMSIASGLVGQSGHVTAAQCREMQADPSGLVELVNHARLNDNYNTLGLAAYMNDVLECRRFLQSVGATDSSSCHVYVQGQFDATLQRALMDNGFTCAREVGASDRSWNRQDMYYNPMRRFALPASCNLEDTQPLATVQGYINKAIATGGLFVAMGHRFEAAAGTITWTQADMNSLLDWLALQAKQGLIDLLKMSEIPTRYVNGVRARD